MLLVYGAYGYTGRLVAAEARARGVPVVLAGRDAERTRAVAVEHGHTFRAFGLDTIDLTGIRAVLHCAGPFSRTAAPMVDACLAAGVPYLDITGEIAVFEALAARDAEARARGVMLLPGVGFDVVPSDCLAAHVVARLPGARRLWIAIAGGGGVSHGTATTMVENLGAPGAVRSGGRIVPVAQGHAWREVDFGDRTRRCVTIPWGDVSTAFHSTGVGDIEVYAAMPRAAERALRWGRPLLGVMGWGWVKGLVQARVEARPAGPSDAERARGWARVVAEAEDDAGHRVRSRLTTPEAYTLTARTALVAGLRAAAGDAPPGFQTPSRAYGADFVLGFDGVTREDVA